MSASIGMKQKHVGMEFLKRTAGIITSTTGDYISDVMPSTTSTLSEAKKTALTISSTFSSVNRSIIPKVKQLKRQINVRNILNWYIEKEDEYDTNSVNENEIPFDVDTSDMDIQEAQISEFERGSNQVSKAVVESSHQMVESQLVATTNMMATVENQTAVISAGFDKTHSILNKILEVVTKNTATLIESTVTSTVAKDPNNDMLSSGKFSISDYKKIVANNFKNSEIGMISQMIAPLLSSPGSLKMLLTPETIAKFVGETIINKKAPNFKKNLQAVDNAVSDIVMTSLIRLGESNRFTMGGSIAKLFGVDASRKNADTSRSSLELKNVPFNSIANESLINAIPGYLRKILVAVGGEDTVYDFRSRSFKSKTKVHDEFNNTAANTGTLYRADKRIQQAMGSDKFGSMLYDLIMNDLGSKLNGPDARNQVSKFKNQDETEKYLSKVLLKGFDLSSSEIGRIKEIANNLGKAVQVGAAPKFIDQAAKQNIARNRRMAQYVDNANEYGMNMSEFSDSAENDKDTILKQYGMNAKRNRKSTAYVKAGNVTGNSYNNMALYEIYRKLNHGINVFQVGSSNTRSKPFQDFGEKYLPRPSFYKPQLINDDNGGGTLRSSLVGDTSKDAKNLLENQTLEDGTTEDLTRSERFKRWGKDRGGNLVNAIFSGSSEQVKDALGLILRDVGQVGAKAVKNKVSSINVNGGNFTGFLKHKITGAQYSYIGDDGQEYTVKKNEKGGYLGYLDEVIFGAGGHKAAFKNMKSTGSKWFKSVSRYFNFGDASNNDDDKGVSGKRKHLLGTSVGAMLGMGLVGGPLGIIMGGVAGSAMSQTNGIGNKIHKLLFGDKDHEGDKKKDRNKRRGLIGRAVDGIVDPIKFQIGKTMTKFGSTLQKNIMGPLSNIGYAIKERMANAAGGVVSKTFGKLFSGMGWLLKKAIMLPFNIAKTRMSLTGKVTRGAMGVAGAVTGFGLNSLAGIIAGKQGREGLKERIKNQKHDAEIFEQESGYYGDYEFDYVQDPNGPQGKMTKIGKKVSKGSSYKSWKNRQDEERDNKLSDVADYTKENVKLTSEIADDLHDLAVEGLTRGSIYTHDDGLHNRIDNIIDILKGSNNGINSNIGMKREKSSNIADAIERSSIASERDMFASSAIGAAASLAVSGENITDHESRLTTGLIDEAAKPNSKKSVISDKLKELMGLQKKQSEESGEKKESFFEKITGLVGNLGGFLSSLLPIGAGLLLLLQLLKDKNIGDTIDRFKESIDKYLKLKDPDSPESKDPVTAGMNSTTALTDMQVEKSTDWVNPLKSILHNETDGAGNGIKNTSATDMKNTWVNRLAIKDILGNTWNNLKLSNNASKAEKYSVLADQYKMDGANVRSSIAEVRASNARNRVNEAMEALNAPRTNTLNAIAKNYARVGTINVIGNISGGIGSGIAKAAGADEQTASTVGRVTTAATSGTLTSNMAISALKHKQSWIDKIIDGVSKLVKFIGEKVGADKAMKKVGASKAAKAITGTTTKITTALKGKIDDIFISKVEKKLTSMGVKNAAAAATAGIAIAGFAVAGLASGLCGTEHLFGVLPDDADAGMKTIAGVFGAAFGALEATPAGWIVCILDIIDGALTAIPGINMGIKQFLARQVYKLFGGAETLDKKQAAMEADRQHLKDAYGVELNVATHNDEINNNGLMSRMWSGKAKVGSDGYVIRDDAGVVLKQGGMKSWFVGKEAEYERDTNGSVIRNENGKAVKAVDEYGRIKKKDAKWGDSVGKAVSDFGRFFIGGDKYKTDENGNAIRDENGKLIVESHEKNFFGKAGDTWNAASDAIGSWTSSLFGGKDKKEKSSGKKKSTTTLNNSNINWVAYQTKKTSSSIASLVSKEVSDENIGPIIADAKNESVNSLITPFKLATEGIADSNKELNSSIQKTASNLKLDTSKMRGNVLKGFITAAFSKFNKSITTPITEMAQGLQESESEADWNRNSKRTSIKDWVKNIWTGIRNRNNIGVGGPDSSDNEGKTDSVNQEALSTVSTISSSATPGGNPLNKPYTITSGFGPRTYPNTGDHSGVDLVPVKNDGTDTEVGSRFSGTVTAVKSNVSDSDTAKKVGNNWEYTGSNSGGNMVTIKTDDGLTIKNMHLKAGSIPSNIAPGTRVNVGDKLGLMGSTGWSTGPHLHYQIEDENGKPINPTQFISGTTMSNFKQNSDSTYPTMDDDINTSDTFDETNSNGSTISSFIEGLKSIGSKFLYAITGGLFGSNSDENNSIISSSSMYTTSFGDNGVLATQANSRWLDIVRKVKQKIAEKKVSYSQSNYTTINIDGKNLNVRTDCTGIISAMLKLYGSLSKDSNLDSRTLLNNGAIKTGFDRASWPGWNKLVPGDILVRAGHAEVFSHNDGNDHYVYNGGSTKTLQTAGATPNSYNDYSVIWRCKEAIQSAVNSITSGSGPVKSNNEQDVWNYLTRLGYTNVAKAGIMGTWAEETHNKASCIEGDHLSKFPGVDKVLSSNKALNDYTQNILFPAYDKSGISLKKDAYVGPDGNYYPGIGIAQWTGERGYKLFNYAKSKGLDWRNLDGQMEFFMNEMNTNARGITPSDINSMRNVDAATTLFANKYEGSYKDSYIRARKKQANRIFSTYGNSQPTDGYRGMGGPVEDENINSNENTSTSSIGISRFTKSAIKASNKVQEATTNIANRITGNTANGTKNTVQKTENELSIINRSSDEYIKRIQELLMMVVTELKMISTNTGASTSILGEINDKDFVDTGLRESLSKKSSNSSSRHSSYRRMPSGTNTRVVASLARP